MSAKGFWLSQDGHVCPLVPPKSSSAAVAGVRFNMAMWSHASILLALGAAGGPIGAITVSVFTALTGGSGVAIPYRLFKQESGSAPFDVFSNNTVTNSGNFPQLASGYTPGSDVVDAFYVIELDAADLLAAGNGGGYVELDVAVGSMGTTAQLLAAYAVLSAGSYTGDQSASAQV
jgi:hypothetical protein